MLPYTIDEIKARVAPIARKYGLAAVYLFGSYARGEATADSDLDLLVDLTGSSVRGFALGALFSELQDAFETEIDLVTAASLEQPSRHRSVLFFRETVKRERVKIYDAA